MKRFAYAAIGLLALTIAHEIGARTARADYNHNGWVVGVTSSGVAWNALGEAYAAGAGWIRLPENDLPVAPGDVKSLAGHGSAVTLVTTTDVVWMKPSGPHPWTMMEPLPGGPVSITPKSWGAIKEDYR